MPTKSKPELEQELTSLQDKIRQAGYDLNQRTVEAERIINEATEQAAAIKAEAAQIRDELSDLYAKRQLLTQEVADLQAKAERIEQEVSDKLTALRQREVDLEIRENQVRNTKRQHNAQLRRNLS